MRTDKILPFNNVTKHVFNAISVGKKNKTSVKMFERH